MSLSPRAHLGRLAAPLAPARLPFYRHTPHPPTQPAVGWYWQPAGALHVVFLGANVFMARDAVQAALDRRRRAA